jgi:hypothetical protein
MTSPNPVPDDQFQDISQSDPTESFTPTIEVETIDPPVAPPELLPAPVVDNVNLLVAPPVELLVSQVLEALQGLQTLTQLALSDPGARDEARRQLERLAGGLLDLADYSQPSFAAESPLKLAWETLSERLQEFSPPPVTHKIVEMPLAPDPVPDESADSKKNKLAPDKSLIRRAVVASLESSGEVAFYINQAAQSFSRTNWQVTNLGANMPIMALTGMVEELRPAVLALIIGHGQLLSETIRLIADLKKHLPGLRVITLGPILARSNLTERLRGDLYSTNPSKAAELAEQFFDPLSRLGDRLKLEVDLSEEPEMTSPKTKSKKLKKEAEG